MPGRLQVVERRAGVLEREHAVDDRLHAVLGDRPAAYARELTKRFETVERGTLSALAASLAGGAAPKAPASKPSSSKGSK